MRALIGRALWWFLDGAHGGPDDLSHRLRRAKPRNAVEEIARGAESAAIAAELQQLMQRAAGRQEGRAQP